MNARRDPETLIEAYVNEGLDELPERSYDAVRAALDSTRQWAVVGPWKEPQIMTATRFALIAAAVAVFAVIAIRLLPSSNVGPPPTTLASPSQGPSQQPLETPSNGGRLDGSDRQLAPGQYLAGDPFLVPLTLTVPELWHGKISEPNDIVLRRFFLNSSQLRLSVFDKIYADPCHPDSGLLKASDGASAADLAAQFATLPGLTAGTATDATLGGYSGKFFTITAPADISACDQGQLRLFETPAGTADEMTPGETQRFWALDVGGQRLVVWTSEPVGVGDVERSELTNVVNSIVIAPPSSAPASS